MGVFHPKSTLQIDGSISNLVVHNLAPEHRHPAKGNFIEGMVFEKSKGQTGTQRLLAFSIDVPSVIIMNHAFY